MNPAGPHRRGGSPQKYFLTEEIRAYLLEHYDSCNRQPIAERFGVPPWQITKWATELGVARTKEPRWTQHELYYLEENIHKKSWAAIARYLDRTPTAVKLKAKRLGLGKLGLHDADGLTQRRLALLLGVDDHRVADWAKAGWIKRQRRGTDRRTQQGGDAWLYTNEAVLRFIVEHPEEVNLRRVDRDWFLGLIRGPIVGSLDWRGAA